jgi:phage terminase small subunit
MKDYNGTQAVIRSGYNRKGAGDTAIRLLRDPEIQKLLAHHERERSLQADIDAVWVMDHLKKNVLRGIELDDLSSINRSLELIGKQIGMFVDRTNFHHTFEQIERIEKVIVDPDPLLIEYAEDDKRRED